MTLFQKNSRKANAIMHSTLLKGFALERRAKDALQFLREYPVEMNEVSFNTLLDAICRDPAPDMMSDAEELVAEMVRRGLKVGGTRGGNGSPRTEGGRHDE